MVNVQVDSDHEKSVVASPTTSLGKPASFEGPLVVRKVSGEGYFLQDPAKPNEVWFGSEFPGTSEYVVEGDADLGAGVSFLSEAVSVEVSNAQAANFGLSVGVERVKVGPTVETPVDDGEVDTPVEP